MKSRLNGVLVFFGAIILGILGFLFLSQDGRYLGHHWMMSRYWLMSFGGLLLLALFGVLIFALTRYPLKQGSSAFQILQQRLVNGEISEDEYNRLNDILNKR